jgi:outer membrane protein OmpA-like peptidoglycan-associated protein
MKKSIIFLLFMLCVLVPVTKMQAQLTYDGWSGGIQVHGLLPANEFKYDHGLKASYLIRGLFRTKLVEDLQGEIGFGAGKYAGLDNLWSEYSTDIFPLDVRFLYSPIYFKSWFPYVYAGGGMMHYSVHTFPLSVSPKSVENTGWTGIIPFGIGAEFNLPGTTSFEVTLGATYSFTDNLNYYKENSANDFYYSLSVGLIFPRAHEAKLEAAGVRSVPAEAEVFKSEVGKAIQLEGIQFATGSAEILPSSESTLAKAYATLKYNPEIEVEINGYTDNVGSAESNVKLSQERAAAVKTYLVNKGIDAARITTKGLGEQNPIASNDTPEGRQKNRRIEFVRTK